MMSGKIIMLNGASSSGNSTVAKALQEIMSEPFWHVSFDQLVDAEVLPPRQESGPFAWWSMSSNSNAGYAILCCFYAASMSFS